MQAAAQRQIQRFEKVQSDVQEDFVDIGEEMARFRADMEFYAADVVKVKFMQLAVEIEQNIAARAKQFQQLVQDRLGAQVNTQQYLNKQVQKVEAIIAQANRCAIVKAPEPWFVHKNYQAFLDGVFPAARVSAPEQIGDMLRAYGEALDAQEALYQKYEQKSDQLEYVRRIEGVFARMHKRIGTLQLVQVFAELRGRIEHFVLFSEDIFTKKADEVRLRQQLDRERRQQKESARARLLADVASMCEALVQDYVNKNVYTYKVFTDENYVTATQDLLRLDVDPANWQQVHDEAKAHAQLMRRAAEQICENGFDDAYFYKVADLEETVAEGVSSLAEDVHDVYAAVTECRQQLRYYRLEFSRLASYTREQRDDLLELIR